MLMKGTDNISCKLRTTFAGICAKHNKSESILRPVSKGFHLPWNPEIRVEATILDKNLGCNFIILKEICSSHVPGPLALRGHNHRLLPKTCSLIGLQKQWQNVVYTLIEIVLSEAAQNNAPVTPEVIRGRDGFSKVWGPCNFHWHQPCLVYSQKL